MRLRRFWPGVLMLAGFLAQAEAQSLKGEARSPKAMVLEATAYTSSPRETDTTPHITATGIRTRLGVLAVSRDLLAALPFGTKVRLRDLGSVQGRGKGLFNPLFREVVFVVADAMNPRFRQRVDVWLPDRATALRFGRRYVELEVLEYPRR